MLQMELNKDLLFNKMSKNRSNRKCCVVNCENTPRNNPKLEFYRFPGFSYELERKKNWVTAVHRQGLTQYIEGNKGNIIITWSDGKVWKPGKNDRICSAHFVGGKKSNNQHNVAYNPTIFPPIYRKNPNLQESLRPERLPVRQKKISSSIVNTASIEVDNNEEGMSPPARHTIRKSAHKIRTDFDQDTIYVDKLDTSPTSSQVPSRKRIRTYKKQTNIGTSRNPSIDLRSLPSQIDVTGNTQEINNKIDNEKNDSLSQETKLHLAEFRLAQYQVAIEHLQSRLEASITELTELNEKHFKDGEYYKEEINSRNRKIAQLENENRALIESLSKKFVKIEDSVQNEKEEKILGY